MGELSTEEWKKQKKIQRAIFTAKQNLPYEVKIRRQARRAEADAGIPKRLFLKSELGGSLQECVIAWDHWLTELRKFNIDTVGQEYRETRKAADWCQAQWEVFQIVMRQFYNIEYHFSRTDEYFGVCTADETDWLFKVEREVK
jgi:hypothetical protein